MAVPGIILTGPPPVPPGLKDTGQAGEENVFCDNPTKKREEERGRTGRDQPSHPMGLGMGAGRVGGLVPPREPRNPSSLSGWAGSRSSMRLAQGGPG